MCTHTVLLLTFVQSNDLILGCRLSQLTISPGPTAGCQRMIPYSITYRRAPLPVGPDYVRTSRAAETARPRSRRRHGNALRSHCHAGPTCRSLNNSSLCQSSLLAVSPLPFRRHPCSIISFPSSSRPKLAEKPPARAWSSRRPLARLPPLS